MPSVEVPDTVAENVTDEFKQDGLLSEVGCVICAFRFVEEKENNTIAKTENSFIRRKFPDKLGENPIRIQ